jgi:hypothetical protein
MAFGKVRRKVDLVCGKGGGDTGTGVALTTSYAEPATGATTSGTLLDR